MHFFKFLTSAIVRVPSQISKEILHRVGLLLNHVSGRRGAILHHQKMTSRINYEKPLKSVRTIRALKIEEYDPQKAFVDDPARPSDADLMHDAGIAFVWENAPGRSKVEQEKIEASSPVELKPPPQALASSKVYSSSVEVPKSPPPVPAGTEANGRSFHNLLDNSHLPTPAAAPAAPTVRSQPHASHHQLPPKPTQSRAPLSSVTVQQQSSDKPPQPRRTTASTASVSQSGHHSGALLSRNGAHDQSARRTAKTRGGQEVPVGKDRHHHSSLTSTLPALTNDEGSSITHSAPLPDSNGGSLVVFSPNEASNGALVSSGDVVAHSGLLSRGNLDYVSARLRQSPAVLGVKDFYSSARHSPLGSTVLNSAHAALSNSCMPTRPNSASPSEAGSHSDDDGDYQTDVGDTFSQMNARDPDGRCEVSMLNGEQHESSSRHTDPRARDFIMERFLPAAKAMVTETSDVSDRISSLQTPLVSPTRKNGRSSLLGRSRFAFKDQFAEEEEQEDIDQTDVLFKCKFPWQMGALSRPTDSRSAEQSPSPSFVNNKYSPSPTASIENRLKESSPRLLSGGQRDDPAWIYAESDGSATPKGDNVCSFEERGLPPKSRPKDGSAIPRSQQYARDTDYRNDSNGSLGVIGESANGEYESEHSGRSNNSSCRASPGVPKDRLKETATQGDCDTRSGPLENLGRSPEMVYSGSLGTLLRTTQQQRRDLGRNSEAAIQAAVASVQEPIPPSSILNHHRNGPARSVAASVMSSAYGSKHSSTKPTYPGNGVHADESNSYPRHLKVNLIRQQVAEPSGGSERSLESLNDEVWESPASSEHFDRSGKGLTSNNSNMSESAHSNSSGWPLVKVQPYARTPSTDSKDASFSSVSELSLRSPTNLAMTVQQPPTEKYSPVSVLQPPLPKSPAESWLFKVRPPVPPSTGTNWQGPKPKKFLDYNAPNDSMDVKWEALVKSENRKMVQEVPRKGTGLEKSEILGSKAR